MNAKVNHSPRNILTLKRISTGLMLFISIATATACKQRKQLDSQTESEKVVKDSPYTTVADQSSSSIAEILSLYKKVEKFQYDFWISLVHRSDRGGADRNTMDAVIGSKGTMADLSIGKNRPLQVESAIPKAATKSM